MAKKKQSLDAKLGSWTDQANLTRTQPSITDPGADPGAAAPPAEVKREEYSMERSLMERIADAAARHDMTQNELVGYLLTWSLDQLDTGAHTIASEE